MNCGTCFSDSPPGAVGQSARWLGEHGYAAAASARQQMPRIITSMWAWKGGRRGTCCCATAPAKGTPTTAPAGRQWWRWRRELARRPERPTVFHTLLNTMHSVLRAGSGGRPGLQQSSWHADGIYSPAPPATASSAKRPRKSRSMLLWSSGGSGLCGMLQPTGSESQLGARTPGCVSGAWWSFGFRALKTCGALGSAVSPRCCASAAHRSTVARTSSKTARAVRHYVEHPASDQRPPGTPAA